MMPNFVLQKVADALNDDGKPIKGSRILLLGVTYKADVADTRESPSLEVLRQLSTRGADVRYCDPHIPSLELDDEGHTAVPWSAEEVAAADCVVMLTQHREFLDRAPLGGRAARRGHQERHPPRRRTSSRSEWVAGAADPGRRVHRRGRGGARAGARGGGRARRQLAHDRARAARRARGGRGARGDRRHPRPRGGRRAARAGARGACCCSPRRPAARSPSASPTTRRRPTSPARAAWRRRSPPRARRSSCTAARCRSTAARSSGEVAAGRPVRRAGRPRAPLEDLRRAGARHARAPRRLRARQLPARDRLRAEPGPARRARTRRPSWTSSAGSRPRASR